MTTKTQIRAQKYFRRRIGETDALLVPRPGTGLIAAQVYVRRGSVDEGPGERGLASFTASMLKRGTARRSSERIAFDLESIGAMTGHGAGFDAASSSVRSAAADFPAALEILFESLREPAFDAHELEVQRESVLAQLRRVEDEKFEYAYREYLKRQFADHGYGHLPEGEIEDVEAVTPELCRAWHAKTYRPENMLLVAAGDFEPDAMTELLEERLADWPPLRHKGYAGQADGAQPTERCDQPTFHGAEQEIHTIEKELEQGFIVLGFRTPPLAHVDHPALRIGCAILGEGFAGRLFTHLRDRRSLAYAVGSALRSHRLGGHMMLYIGTEPGRLDEALEGLRGEVRAMRDELAANADIERARAYVAGKYAMSHQSLASRAAWLAQWEDHGLGADYDEQYVEALRRVTPVEVQRAALHWWNNPTVVVLRPKSAAS